MTSGVQNIVIVTTPFRTTNVLFRGLKFVYFKVDATSQLQRAEKYIKCWCIKVKLAPVYIKY